MQYQALSVLDQERYASSLDRAKQLISAREELRGSQIASLVELRRPDSGEVFRLEYKLTKNGQPAGFLITDLGPQAMALLYSGEGSTLVESEILEHATDKEVAAVYQYGGLGFALDSDEGEFISMSDDGSHVEDWILIKEEWQLHAQEIEAQLTRPTLDALYATDCPVPTTYLPKNNSQVPAWNQFPTKRVFGCLVGCGPIALGQLLAWTQENMDEDIQIYDPDGIYQPPTSKNAKGKIIEEIGRLLETTCIPFTNAGFTNYFLPKRFRRNLRAAVSKLNQGDYPLDAKLSYLHAHSDNLKPVAKELKENRRPSIVFGWSPHTPRRISNQHIYTIDGHKDGCFPEYRYNKGHGKSSVWASQQAFFYQLKGSIQLKGQPTIAK